MRSDCFDGISDKCVHLVTLTSRTLTRVCMMAEIFARLWNSGQDEGIGVRLRLAWICVT